MTIAWDPVLLAATQVSLARFPLPSLSCQKPPGSRVGGEASLSSKTPCSRLVV